MTSSNSSSISIITATFNSASVLPRLIDSLIEQTDQDFEWIVADGGSRDETLRIIEKASNHRFSSRFWYIRCIKSRNKTINDRILLSFRLRRYTAQAWS
jgi:glycosyltransferase involved in cell wall biosynthesis